MKKLLCASLLLFGANAMAANAETCFKDSLGSSNYIYAPAANTNNSWTVEYTITNVAETPVTVKIEMQNIDGQAHTPSGVSYFGNFDANNNPADLTNGATLQPGELGRLILNDNTVAMIGPAKISWTADKCIEEALSANFNNQFNTSSRLDRGLLFLNGGKPF